MYRREDAGTKEQRKDRKLENSPKAALARHVLQLFQRTAVKAC